MELKRRNAILMGAGAFLVANLPVRASASVEDVIAEFTGGAEVGTGDIIITAPEIAENGNTVPIEVSSGTAVEILVLATGNPTPNVATFKFGKLAASRAASTRIRLAGTQDVVAIAKLDDGSFVKASSTVKVTIGGCGG
ncbi:MAG: sulfur-oxidizing protein SoxY [Ascidiaceihabitans sp.]|jgi:sulfur-oxidizing protein SoxY